jgi:radical SAM family uncharacterized protein/radical SAM-linked protein
MEHPCGPYEGLLPHVEKPARYVGNEHNIVRKQSGTVAARFALAFPDVYEIGMSHVGSRILYHVVNSREEFAAERAYAPWVDMEARLRRAATPLSTLESHDPLSSFDVVGFTIQHELCYTNMLAMLELGGVPLRASDRNASHPIVIVGGPSAVNPEPIAEFVDAVALGDAEDLILEICATVAEAKRENASKEDLLWRLCELKGMYVPSFFRVTNGRLEPFDSSVPPTIVPRVHEKLGVDDFPLRPLVPLTEAVHDRLSIEVMRGCPQRCRFCQATQVYSPCRTRSPEAILQIAQAGIESSGYDEISLISLSTSDYPRLSELAARLNLMFFGQNIALSLPSLRPGTFALELAKQITKVRRAGLTFAPEAGTDQLRDAIGKPMEDEEFLQALETAYEAGYSSVKLYFMVGLPGETTDDLNGIVDLVRTAEQVARSFGRGRRLHVSVAPFVPKPHTPFQWAPFQDAAILQDKEVFLKRRLRSSRVTLRWRDPQLSFIEAVFSRGDRRLCRVVESAYRSGARFDDWTDRFDPDGWMAAFQLEGVDPSSYTRALPPDEELPWEHLAVGRGTQWCRREWHRAQEIAAREPAAGGSREFRPADARERATTRDLPQSAEYGRRRRPARGVLRRPATVPRRVRMLYSKRGCARFLSHLDVVRSYLQALRRLRVPLQYTEGFTPRPKLAFSHPLPLGMASSAELVDVWLAKPPPPTLVQALTTFLPEGITILEAREIFPKAPSLTETVNAVAYTARVGAHLSTEDAEARLRRFLQRTSCFVVRRTKGSERRVDLRGQVLDGRLTDEEGSVILHVTTRVGEPGQGKPRDLFAAILDLSEAVTHDLGIDRTAQYVYKDGVYSSPMEAS